MTEQGWVAPAVASEFPGLGIASTEVDGPSGRSPESVRRRLRTLSDRFMGGHAVHMRERPIPWAYRVFFRQIGLDPDHTRTPVEAARAGTDEERGVQEPQPARRRPDHRDIETGVALRAFDAARVDGELGIRETAPGEELEGRPGSLPQGTLVISDERRPLAMLFGATAERRGVHPSTDRIILAAIQVKGVPQIAVDEALWLAAAVMAAGE